MNQRDLRIALDHAHGMTFEQIARNQQIHPSRAHQIYKATLVKLNLGVNATATDIGLAIQRREAHARSFHNGVRLFDPYANTPEAFHNELKVEKQLDFNRRFG